MYQHKEAVWGTFIDQLLKSQSQVIVERNLFARKKAWPRELRIGVSNMIKEYRVCMPLTVDEVSIVRYRR